MFIYLLWMRQNIINKRISLNCSKKLCSEEYELMKKYNTAYHLEKLKNSDEFKSYMKKKMSGSLKPIDLTDDKIEFSDED